MPKLVVTENVKDSGLTSTGGGLTVTNTGPFTQEINASNIPKYNIEFQQSQMKDDEELPYEVATIKINPIGSMTNFVSEVSRDFSPGVRTNHFFKIPEMVDLGETQTENYSDSVSQASYSFETIFNYISEDYDKLQAQVSEANLYAAIDNVTMDNFINIQNETSMVVNFARGSEMENFVIPTMNIKQGTKEAPYYNYLRINQRIGNGISNFAVKMGIFDELLQDYLEAEKINVSFDTQVGREVDTDSNIGVYDLQSFLTTDRPLDMDNFFTLNRSVRPSRMSIGLRKLLLKGFLKDAASLRTEDISGRTRKPGFRRFRDIHRNIESHKEVFCYSAAKHDGAVLTSTLNQTLYAPALEASTPIVDTQVKYGKSYSYKVIGHYMIVGNSYEYQIRSSSTDPSDPYVIVQVTNRPSIVMIPLDIFTKKVNVVQMPPVYPQVSFKTQNDSSNKISMYLSPTKSERKERFEVITQQDQLQDQALFRLPNARDLLGNVRFKTYGDQGLYEVFRLDDPPESYRNFRDAKIGEISMPFETTDAIFKDKVIANRQYYYMFRSINQKGMVSNPTAVYEITLLVDADDSKIITNIYNFPNPRDSEPSMQFRKLFRITPAVEHVVLDSNQPVLFNKDSLIGTLDNIKLGIKENAVWGRKFKIRIKSKTSGKIIDIILNVDLTKNKTEEEF